MRSFARVAVIGAVVAATATAASIPASAAPTEYLQYSMGLGAEARFQTYGDILYVKDRVADGRSAIGVIDNGTQYYYWNRTGQGTTRKIDLDLLENKAIALGAAEGDWQGTPTGGIRWGTLSTSTIMTS